MIGSLRALLAGAIDYAGLFPPARLPLAVSLQNFVRYSRTDQAWMLGHFVLPVGQLEELGALIGDHDASSELVSATVVTPTEPDRGAWLAAVERHLAAISQFNLQYADKAAVRAIELRLPCDTNEAIDQGQLAALLDAMMAKIVESPARPFSVFVEASFAGTWRANVEELVNALTGCRRHWDFPVGLKLRTGGLDPTAFPTPEQVAAVIRLCRDASLPWKATAGLHHALRQYRNKVGAEMHGFVNLLVATVLAHAESLDEPEIADILRDSSPRSFVCEEGQISWHNRRATLHQIRQARQDGILSFGSCSFDEPREELEQLASATNAARL